MQKPKAHFLAILFLLALTAFSREPHRYPWVNPPHLSIQRTGQDTARVITQINTNLYFELLEASSLNGPWGSSTGELNLSSSNRFIKAVVNLYNIQINPEYTVSTIRFAVRVADPGLTQEFTTSNGFRLKLEVTNWYEGISVFRVDDGPTSGDLAADFQRLQNDLLADDRTLFVSPATNGSCILGQTDIFSIRKDTSTNLDKLADYELEVIGEEPNAITVRWTNAKSRSLSAEEEQLKAAGIDASSILLGCETL